jgi:hypothetical protein
MVEKSAQYEASNFVRYTKYYVLGSSEKGETDEVEGR